MLTALIGTDRNHSTPPSFTLSMYTHTTLGVVLSSTGRKAEAIESWKQAVALDATQFNALYNLWLELAQAGRGGEAAAYGRQFVGTAPPAFFRADIARVAQSLKQP